MGATRAFDALIGTGGIGSGMFFALEGNDTVGRGESRVGRLLDQRDYCKLHIICHYVKKLLGPTFPVIPVGRVGHDQSGLAVLDEMTQTGLDMEHIATSHDLPTLFAVCFTYPDGDGGNLTTSGSASSAVTAEDVGRASSTFKKYRGRGVALAVPEVPLAARVKLLEIATEYEFLRIASFVTGEIPDVLDRGLLGQVDVLAINLDEAAAVADLDTVDTSAEVVATTAVSLLQVAHPSLKVVVTAGMHGSWVWDGNVMSHAPACEVVAVSTAGAGDAHLAGLVVGLVSGLDVTTANQFASLISAMKVTSQHTINPAIDAASAIDMAEHEAVSLPAVLQDLLTASRT